MCPCDPDLQHDLQNLLYQFGEFTETRFHIAPQVHAQRPAIAVG